MADETPGATQPASPDEQYPSARLLMEAARWEFETDDKRHTSLTSRATVLLSVGIAILGLTFTGLSFLLSRTSGLSNSAMFLVLVVIVLIAIAVIASGAFAILAIKTNPIEVPAIESLLDPERHDMHPNTVAKDFTDVYGKLVRSHREKGQAVASNVDVSGYLLLTALALLGILVLAVVIGRK